MKLILNCPRALAITCLSHKGQNFVQRATFKVLQPRKQVCWLSLFNRLAVAREKLAMVTYCATKLTATCSPMIGQFVDTNRYRVVIMTHQTLSLEKYWNLKVISQYFIAHDFAPLARANIAQ